MVTLPAGVFFRYFLKITLFEDIKAQDQQVFKLCLLHCLQSQNDHRPRFSLQISGFFFRKFF